jgi:hypothetical protein
MNTSDPDHPPSRPSESTDIDDPQYQEALGSTRWFAYIAVGIAIFSMCAGLAFMARLVYLFFRSLS